MLPSDQGDMEPAGQPDENSYVRGDPIEKALVHYKATLKNAALVYILQFGIAKKPKAIELAEEVYQNVALKVLSKADDFDRDRPALPWLWGFVRNQVFELQRERFDERKRITPIGDMSLASGPGERSRELSESVQFDLHAQEKIEEILGMLSAEDQLVLRLHAQGLSGAEMAEELTEELGKDVNEGAAYVRLYRARKRARAAYQQRQEQTG